MQKKPDFSHLNLTYKGSSKPKFSGGSKPNAEVQEIRKNPSIHVSRVQAILKQIRKFDSELRLQRRNTGLPQIPSDKGFLLKLPEGIDVDSIIKALGVELVAETEDGLMLVSSEDIEFKKIEKLLTQFSENNKNITAASALLDIYYQPDDPRRLKKILEPKVLKLWPLLDDQIYMFDIGIQTASSTREIRWPRMRKKKNEQEVDYSARKNNDRQEAFESAQNEWDKKAEMRYKELEPFVEHYKGEFLTGIMSQQGKIKRTGIIFPDSMQVRIRMNGAGFRDIILNFAHLFDVALPPEVEKIPISPREMQDSYSVIFQPPEQNSPAVCIIDSGIQENHKWLEPAIDKDYSRCFLPESTSDDVADYCSPSGHGTRVAGAVLYPLHIPTEGNITPIAWLQNARVLDKNCQLPNTLPPELYLQQVVDHYNSGQRTTKIYNHSINDQSPSNDHRMTAWASKMDQLSYEKDVLFIQSAGNEHLEKLRELLTEGRIPPQHQLEPSMRVTNPAQSLHSLTVGSVSQIVYEDGDCKSFASIENHPSGFSRSGFSEPWSVVKPEVVEYGGDLVYEKNFPNNVKFHNHTSIELLCSTLHSSPAFLKDGAGTSFSTPKVSHIAAQLQSLYPRSSPLLYRALIVQSARWPLWAETHQSTDEVLRLIGYGIPSKERATVNSENRVTLITPEAVEIYNKQFHLYTINIPKELRKQSLEAEIRIDVTLAYSALPRRTRARRTGYLETWLDWKSSKCDESIVDFSERIKNGGNSNNKEFSWQLHTQDNFGKAQGTNRTRGTVQKDWAIFKSYNFPNEFGIAVRAHNGWNHLEGAGKARYCLVVSFESIDNKLPLYSLIKSAIQIETETETKISIEDQISINYQ